MGFLFCSWHVLCMWVLTLAMMGRRREDFTTDGAQRMNVEKDLVRVVGVF